jgi:hypothetical protein
MAEPAMTENQNLPDTLSDRFDLAEAFKLHYKHHWTFKQLEQKYNIPDSTISDRFKSIRALIDDPEMDQTYDKFRADILNAAERKMVSLLSDTDKLEKASLNNVAYALTQITNARRLEKDQSTANIAQNVHTKDLPKDELNAIQDAIKSLYKQRLCQDGKVEENSVVEAEIVKETDE